jgi:hypothetical protein
MPHPNNPNGAALAILERRKNVAARYVRGETQWEIARAFEVDQKTISNDLAAIRKEWLADAVRSVDEIKARELAKIDECEAQAWRAWTKSQENAETLRARVRGKGDDARPETEKVTKGQAGDPRFLDLVLKCVEKRCLILGVYDSAFEAQIKELRARVEALILSDAGFTPDPWQSAMLRQPTPQALLLAARQTGKSRLAGAIILREALLHPGSLILILSKRLDQAVYLLQDKVYTIYHALGCPVPLATRPKAESMELSNGSRVLALPNNEAGVRSYSSVRLIVIDEASRVPDVLYRAVRPMLSISRGMLLALSTAFGKRGWFYDEWERGANFHRFSVKAEECLRHRWYRQEYENSFEDDIAAIFSQEVIVNARDADLLPLLME